MAESRHSPWPLTAEYSVCCGAWQRFWLNINAAFGNHVGKSISLGSYWKCCCCLHFAFMSEPITVILCNWRVGDDCVGHRLRCSQHGHRLVWKCWRRFCKWKKWKKKKTENWLKCNDWRDTHTRTQCATKRDFKLNSAMNCCRVVCRSHATIPFCGANFICGALTKCDNVSVDPSLSAPTKFTIGCAIVAAPCHEPWHAMAQQIIIIMNGNANVSSLMLFGTHDDSSQIIVVFRRPQIVKQIRNTFVQTPSPNDTI